MRYGYDYLDDNEALKTVATGSDRGAARRGAAKMSKKFGSAAMLFYSDHSNTAIGAVTYVDGYRTSSDGVTRAAA